MLGSQCWGDGDVGVPLLAGSDVGVPMLGSQCWGDDGDVGVVVMLGSRCRLAVMLGSQCWGPSFGVTVMLGSQCWGDGDVGVPLSARSDVGVAVLG